MRAEAGAVAAVAGALLVGAVPHQHYARRGAVSAARPVRNLRTGVACRAQFGRMGRTVKRRCTATHLDAMQHARETPTAEQE